MFLTCCMNTDKKFNKAKRWELCQAGSCLQNLRSLAKTMSFMRPTFTCGKIACLKKTGLQQRNFSRKTKRVGLAFQDTDRRLWSTKDHSEILVPQSGKQEHARRGQKYMLSRNACKMMAVRMQHELLQPELQDGCRRALHIADTQHGLDAAVDKVAQALKALKPQEQLRPATQTAITTLMHDIGEMILQPALQRTARMLREARKQENTWEDAVFNYSNEEYVRRFIDPAVRSLCHGAAVQPARESEGDFEARVMQTTVAVNDTLLQGLEAQTVITPRGELIALEVHRLTGSLKTLFILKGAGIGISPDAWRKSSKDWRKVALPAITPGHNIHVFIDNCGIYHKHTARSNLDTILKPKLHTAVFVIITLQENGRDSPQMKPLDSLVANPPSTVPENLIPEARGPKLEEMLQNYVNTCKVNVLRTGFFDDVARQQSESWRNMKYCPAADCKDEKTYPKSKRTCDTCSSSLASCEKLMEILANSENEGEPEGSHGDDEDSDADDIPPQAVKSDSDDSDYEETDVEQMAAHSKENERAGSTAQTSRTLGPSAAPSMDQGTTSSISSSSTMALIDEPGRTRSIPCIVTMPWLCPDNGPRQWIDITGDLVTLAVSKGTLGQPQANPTSGEVSRQQEGERRADVHSCRLQRRTDQMSLATQREVCKLHAGIAGSKRTHQGWFTNYESSGENTSRATTCRGSSSDKTLKKR
jgi:hypothetical protein